jgi:uncharacterized protein (DUF1499 family)
MIVFNSVNKFISIIFVISLLNFLIFAIAGPGYQIGLFHWRTGLLVIMKYTAFISIPLLAIIVLIIITTLIGKFELNVKSKKILRVALIFPIIVLVFVLYWKNTLSKYPYIHDITTDFDNPPQFTFAEELRNSEVGSSPITYDGSMKVERGPFTGTLSELQKEHYPDISNFIVNRSISEIKNIIEVAMLSSGIKISGYNEENFTIEGMEKSTFFGFTDDIAVRMIKVGSGEVLVDIRSKSRQGASDLGQNAKRIERLKASILSKIN